MDPRGGEVVSLHPSSNRAAANEWAQSLKSSISAQRAASLGIGSEMDLLRAIIRYLDEQLARERSRSRFDPETRRDSNDLELSSLAPQMQRSEQRFR